jgi:hypothetical protein
VLSSTDNGATWHDHASGPAADEHFYAIGGAREITEDGLMIGSYVDANVDAVKFFRVPVELPGPPRLRAAVTASVAHPSHLPSKAGDSDFVSLWAASLTAAPINDDAWVLIDLGAEKQVSALKWKGATGSPYPLHSPAAYSVEISSDGSTWTQVATHAGTVVIDGNEPIDAVARYVRLVTTQVNDGTGWALGLFEIWVEGTDLPGARLAAVGSASSAAAGYPPSNATDGSAPTAWVASLTPSVVNNAAWFQLDLGSVKHIDRLQWSGAAGVPYPASSPTDYTIEVSNDGISWLPVAERANPGAVFLGDEPIAGNHRFIRVVASKVNDGTGWSLGFHELWAEGIDVPTFRMPASIVTSSSAAGHPSVNAGDGSAASVWVASTSVSPANNQARVLLDLGKVQRVHRLLWKGATGQPYPASSPADYTIDVSTDRSAWTTVAARANASGVSDGVELIERDARYIRMTTSKVNDGSGWSLGLHEIWAE